VPRRHRLARGAPPAVGLGQPHREADGGARPRGTERARKIVESAFTRAAERHGSARAATREAPPAFARRPGVAGTRRAFRDGMREAPILRRRTAKRARGFTLVESVEIDAPVEDVFARWEAYETLPRVMESVRRTKCIDEHRVLWDVDIGGHQLVWAARIVERSPGKSIRWESTWGVRNCGEVRFEAPSEGRTRLTVEVAYRPRGLVEHLGARFGLADIHVRADLQRFRRFVERQASFAPARRAAR